MPPQRDVITAVRPSVMATQATREVLTSELAALHVAGGACRHEQQPAKSLRLESAASSPCVAPASHEASITRGGNRPEIKPLTADLRRLHVTVSSGFMQKLEAATAALSHSHPSASMEDILEAGLDLLLERDAKRKGLVEKPQRKERPSADDRQRQAHLRHAHPRRAADLR